MLSNSLLPSPELVSLTPKSWHSHHSISLNSWQNWSHWHHTQRSDHWHEEGQNHKPFAAGERGKMRTRELLFLRKPLPLSLSLIPKHPLPLWAFHHLKSYADFPGHQLFHGGQHNWISNLFPFTVSFDLPIQSWRFSGFSMGIVWPHCIHLQVQSITEYAQAHPACEKTTWALGL